ncbi:MULTISPECIES: DUF1002 domain-containing protein [Staphylococcus]|uniref:DUF1002 domain-containing protein n=1 Tax=Staphylococcus TaxID=1279 RepID=UPI00044C62C5|nr:MULTISPECIES: DUF1002 domain-containing protein [Staphylococcus]EZW50447.1 hypothetical protein U970_02500 [Staphylococcus aureus 56824-10]GBY66386.1 hypothetical protein M6K074_2790 [Staphylococcus aureus]GBY66423.1 hypothetical protein M6K074_2827 [Staphylococcus aureus]
MKKILGAISATLLTTTTLIGSTASAEQSQDMNNEKQPELKEDVITYGGNLNSNQKDEVKEKLGGDDKDKTVDVTLEDVKEFTGVQYDHIYSSSLIEPKSFGKGVDVEIVTPDNITKITKEQYTNAAISAGIQNAKIRVASTVEPTTGDGALTGIVKAYAKEGTDLSESDAKNANQEMSDLANISDENKDKEGYSDAAMNNAVADMKSQVAQEKEDNGNVSEDKVRSIVDDVLKEKGLDGVVSDNQRNTIYNIVINVSKSNAMNNDPKSFMKQLDKYKGQLEKNHGDLIDKAKDKAKSLNNEENRNLLQKIVDFIMNILQAIVDFFKNLFN